MGWAKRARKALREGEDIVIKPRGHSMEPLVKDGAAVTLAPVSNPNALRKGDIVFARVKGRDYLHLIKGTRRNQVLIGNNKGGVNGWTSLDSVYGIAAEIDNG